MRRSSAQPGRKDRLVALLKLLLHPDVIPLVLSYEVTIQFELQRLLGSRRGALDGQMAHPSGLLLHADELFVVDQGNCRIQVFHQGSGRFLRKWGQYGFERHAGRFRCPTAIALSPPRAGVCHLDTGKNLIWDEAEIFVVDVDQIQVFRLRDCQFQRRFQIEENGTASVSNGIAVMGEEILVSRSYPHQIDVMRKSNGERVRILAQIESSEPGRLWIDETAMELWLAEPGHDRIVVLDVIHGDAVREYGGATTELRYPQAVACHGDEVIVCDPCNQRLVIFDRLTCQKLRIIASCRRGADFQDGGRTPIEFSYPLDLAISLRNELFVCDSTNHRVLIFQ